MKSDAILLSPEVADLVIRIAQRPDSTFLRVPAGSAGRALIQGPIIRERQPGLSSAERHLVAVYRDELAFALRALVWAKLCGDASKHDPIVLRQTATTTAPAAHQGDAAEMARQALHVTPSELFDSSTRTLLEACVSAAPDRGPSIIELASAAQRLAPSFQALYNTAAWYALQERVQPSAIVLRQAIATCSTRFHAALSWALVAEVAARARNWRRAMSASQVAIRMQPELLAPYVALAWSAVQLCDPELSRDALLRLRQRIGADYSLVGEQRARFISSSAAFASSLSAESRTVLARLMDGSEPLAGELFHAFR